MGKVKFHTSFDALIHELSTVALHLPPIFGNFRPVVDNLVVANYYTLRHITLQLNQRLKSWSVREIFSQNKNELIIAFEAPGNQGEQSGLAFLTVRCEPSENCIFLMDSFARARRNSIDLLQRAVNSIVSSVSIHSSDRQISILLDSGLRLVVQMFGSKANVLLVGQDDVITDSFLKSKEVIGQSLSSREDREALPDRALFSAQLKGLGEMSVGVAMKKFFPRFGGLLLEELFHRAVVARSETVDRLSEDEIQRLFQAGADLISELEVNCKPSIYYDGEKAVAFSIIDLHHCRQYEKQEFDTISEAIRHFLGTTKSLDHTVRERTRLQQGLKKELERISRTLMKITEETETADRAGEYETMGRLLKSHLHEIQKGSREVILENTLEDPGNQVRIPLDKNLSPAKNADRYFEKAKKTRAAAVEKNRQKSKLTEEQTVLRGLLGKSDQLSTGEDIRAFITENQTILRALGLVKSTASGKPAPEVPFRVFKVAGDFTVWAGKSGENNDLLSTRHTKPKDLWFHARAVGGSHVVLKFGTGKGEISKRAIEEAAAIAAYYSKMKNSKLAPVSVCEGKYVRKPKGAPAGTVTIEREKVIFVEPRLPKNE